MPLPTAIQSNTLQRVNTMLINAENSNVPPNDIKGNSNILGRKLRNRAFKLSLHPTLMPT